MFAFVTVIYIACFVLALAGVAALLLGARHVSNRQRLMRSSLVDTRTELKRVKTNAKHTKAHRARHDQTEMLQFGFVKLRDIGTDLVKIADTYAEHAARESQEVDR